MVRVTNWAVLATFALFVASQGAAEPVTVPNGSFELPATFFVNTRVEQWQETPKPAWYQEGGGYEWDQLTGVFRNPPAGANDHLVNCDGEQAFYLFAVPEVGIFQDYSSLDWNDAEQSHSCNARFEIGRAYELTFGVVGGGANMLEGVTIEAALYALDESNQPLTVARREIVFTKEQFPNRTEFTELSLRTPVVQPGDPWAGRPLGIRFLSTVSQELQGGYWDLDRVRLTALGETPFATHAMATESGLRLTWPSQAGTRYQVEISADFAAWSATGTAVEGTGAELGVTVPWSDTGAFFRVVTAPDSP